MTQTAWLLEWPADDNLPTQYWNPKTGWMMDPNKACWFARGADAGDYKLASNIPGIVRPVEHIFGLALPSPEPSPVEPGRDGSQDQNQGGDGQ